MRVWGTLWRSQIENVHPGPLRGRRERLKSPRFDGEDAGPDERSGRSRLSGRAGRKSGRRLHHGEAPLGVGRRASLLEVGEGGVEP
jgi:hypothetical protein